MQRYKKSGRKRQRRTNRKSKRKIEIDAEKKERQARKREFAAGKLRKKQAVKAADACRRCSGNFQWPTGGVGEKVETRNEADREKEKQARERGRRRDGRKTAAARKPAAGS